ncbi:hypothetical protein ILUMI_23909 [Ignelater luminosus]|uniref:HTH psq-type domain-containing protein n=1 Tax=Ignelater luminosus TaxID=2038154 RepID=A0A8K0CEH8_IGNLU|nr:hypothetical protein ILUMI_23909 [Ignelater luminosus]
MDVNETAKSFNIPKTALKRRIKSNNTEKCNRLGPYSTLGADAEEKLANHIKKLQKNGFSPTKQEVREMAYKVAVELGIKHWFNEIAGPSGVHIAQNRTPEKSSSMSDISPGKELDLVLPVPIITLAAKKACRQIAGVLSSDKCITKQPKTKRQNNKRRQPSKMQKKASSSSESEEVVLDKS